jgi:PDDEXK-like uncharacterized protein DUF3799
LNLHLPKSEKQLTTISPERQQICCNFFVDTAAGVRYSLRKETGGEAMMCTTRYEDVILERAKACGSLVDDLYEIIGRLDGEVGRLDKERDALGAEVDQLRAEGATPQPTAQPAIQPTTPKRLTLAPGIHRITNEEYHSDPGETPSLSRGIINCLLTSTPAHVYAVNKRLNPRAVAAIKEDKFDVGTFAHALFLEGEDSAIVFEHKDWKKAEAQQDRADARAKGKIPFLRHQYTQCCDMVEAAHRQLAQAEECPVADLYAEGVSEETYIWRETEYLKDKWGKDTEEVTSDVLCRCRGDWRSNDWRLALDYKTTTCADPGAWHSHIIDHAYDVQSVFYPKGMKAAAKLEKNPRFVFLVQETKYPFLVSFISLPPEFVAMAEEKIKYGKFLWQRCLMTGEWPGYSRRIAYVEPRPFALASWEAKKFEIDNDGLSE